MGNLSLRTTGRARYESMQRLKAVDHSPRAERYARGKSLRRACPRRSHARWAAPPNRPHPLHFVSEADKGRLRELLPLRHSRMALSPFTFYRGSALNMAADLASTPSTGVRVQCGGDCHLVNFRGFATPERQIIFAINDLDETLPAPWEWDVKRLAASFVIACRDNGLGDAIARDAVATCVRSYREHMGELSEMNPLDQWYLAIDIDTVLSTIKHSGVRRRTMKRIKKARARDVAEDFFPRIAHARGDAPIIKDRPPTILHWEGHSPGELHPAILPAFALYRDSMTQANQVVLDRYEMRDAAIKVVGVGSVGTACWVLLLTDGEGHALVLQVKEARASVLEVYAGKSVFRNHGQRVVAGHWLMQPASDIFLGWTVDNRGRHYYLRQLRDVKIKFDVENFGKAEMTLFADWCGHSLALSHARSGDPVVIGGYLGRGERFDRALTAFAVAYADQNEKDYAELKGAIRRGKIKTS
jgi:uncharacterized protein (DUF2252 family)